MLNQKQILEYAVKGLMVDIQILEKEIKKGYEYIKQIDNGEKPKTPKTKYEIQEICKAKKAEMEQLEKEHFELRWQLSEMK